MSNKKALETFARTVLSHGGARLTGGTPEAAEAIENAKKSLACAGHVASKEDPKICGRCGVHIDEL